MAHAFIPPGFIKAWSLLTILKLVYPSGNQRLISGHPHRWTVVQAIFKEIERHLWTLRQQFPHSIEIVSRFDGVDFPIVQFFRDDAMNALMERLVTSIISGRTPLLPADCVNTKSAREGIKNFITAPKIAQDDELFVTMHTKDQPALLQTLYLLRGLIVYRILPMTLRKR